MQAGLYHTVVCFPVTLGLAYSTNSSISTGHAPEKKQQESTRSLLFKINVDNNGVHTIMQRTVKYVSATITMSQSNVFPSSPPSQLIT